MWFRPLPSAGETRRLSPSIPPRALTPRRARGDLFKVLASVAFAAGLPGVAVAEDQDAPAAPSFTAAAPTVHDNLAVYLVTASQSTSAMDQAPLTLEEAIATGVAKVFETGSVNQLSIENFGDRPVFLNAGEIVKGGRQDRILSASLLIPPHSGKTPLDAFCVERSRWTQRGDEKVEYFAMSPAMASLSGVRRAMNDISLRPPRPTETSAASQAEASSAPNFAEALSQMIHGGGSRNPSREAAPEPNVVFRAGSGSGEGSTQDRVWSSVTEIQSKLAKSLRAEVAASASPTSLQLTLENDALQRATELYLEALAPLADASPDAIGYVYAVNGVVRGGDVYASPALFRKLWPKLVQAAAVEAIGDRETAGSAAPAVAKVNALFAHDADGASHNRSLPFDLIEETQSGAEVSTISTRMADGRLLHRSYLAE